MAKIVGEDLKPYVINQIKVRQGNNGHGSGVNDARTDSTIKYLNSKTAFVKLASGVYMEKERISEEELKDGNSNLSLAKNYVLSGGVTRYDSKTDNWEQRSRGAEIKDEFSGAYGVNPSSNHKLSTTNNPMPGIESVTIQPINRGSITKAQVQIKCYSPEQFQLIELLYMRLGYTVLLEWGNSQYLNNNGGLEHMGYTLIEDTSDEGFFDGYKKDFYEYYDIIEKKREKTYGNYDAILARITNFSWEFNQSMGVYNITLNLVSEGDIVETLKLNVSPSKDIFKEENGVLSKSEAEEKNKANNIVTQYLELLTLFSKNQFSPKGSTSSQISVKYGGGASDVKQFGHFVFTPGDGLKSRGLGSRFSQISEYFNKFGTYGYDPNDIIRLNTMKEESGSDYRRDYESYYIRMGNFLQFLNDYAIPKKKTDDKNIININFESNPMYRAPYQISFDPRVCIVYNTEPLNSKIAFPELKPWSGADSKSFDPTLPCLGTNDYGDMMNIYLNFNEIQTKLDNNLDDKGNLNIFEFLSSICTDINRAMGGVNNLEPIIDENRTIFIVDSSYTCAKQSPIPNPYQLIIYGYGENNINSTFVRNFSIKSSITPELATMITIGATAGGYVKGTENTMFSKWNKGIIDRFQDGYYSPNEIKENNPQEIVKRYVDTIYDKFGMEPYGYELGDIVKSGVSESPRLLSPDIIEKNVSTASEFYKYLNSYIASQDPEYASPINGFIPISLDTTMDGMSGIKIYNSIDVDTRFLPKNYGKNLNFIIKGVSHKLQNQDWETTFQTVVTTKSTKNGVKYPYQGIKDYTDLLLLEYSDPTGQKSNGWNIGSTYTVLDFHTNGRISPTVISSNFEKIHPNKLQKGKDLVTYFQNKLGLTRKQSAALVGNLYAESKFIPDIIEDKTTGGYTLRDAMYSDTKFGKKGYGYAQFTYETRQAKLAKIMGGVNKKATDQNNKDMIVLELTTSSKPVLSEVKNTKGDTYELEYSSVLFLNKYENPADQSPNHAALRINYAKQLL
jgi:hypothetical protein